MNKIFSFNKKNGTWGEVIEMIVMAKDEEEALKVSGSIKKEWDIEEIDLNGKPDVLMAPMHGD